MFINTGREWKAPALATFGYLSGRDGIEPSWDNERKEYRAETLVADWFNGREKGFSLIVTDKRRKVLSQVFIVYEHRSSDTLCILHWDDSPYAMMNPPTVNTLPEGLFESSGDYTVGFAYHEAAKAADWIIDKLNEVYFNAQETED